MPVISVFFGIIVRLFYREHDPLSQARVWRAASALNLLEEKQEPLDISGGAARVDVSGFGLRTVELVPALARPLHVPR